PRDASRSGQLFTLLYPWCKRVACPATDMRPAPRRPSGDVALYLPGVDLALGLLAAVAVSFLELADQDLGVPLDLIDLIVRQLAPLLPDLALELSPLPFQRVSVHVASIPRGRAVLCRTCREVNYAGPGGGTPRLTPRVRGAAVCSQQQCQGHWGGIRRSRRRFDRIARTRQVNSCPNREVRRSFVGPFPISTSLG